jgi:hypothetical protein
MESEIKRLRRPEAGLEIDELQAENETELAEIARKHESEERLASLSIECLAERCLRFQHTGQSEIEKIAKELEDTVRANEMEERVRSEDNETEIRYELGEFQQARSDLLSQHESFAVEFGQTHYILHPLEETLQLMSNEFTEQIEELQGEISRENDKLVRQVEETRELLEDEGNGYLTALNESVRRRMVTYTTIVSDRRNHLEIGGRQNVEATRLQIASDLEIESVLRQYQQTYDEAIRSLDRIAPPRSEGSEQFAIILSRAENEKTDLQEEIERARLDIASQSNTMLESEIARHCRFMDTMEVSAVESSIECVGGESPSPLDSDIRSLAFELEQIRRLAPKPRDGSISDDSIIVTMLADLARLKELYDRSTSQALHDRAICLICARQELDKETEIYFRNLDHCKTVLEAELRQKTEQIAAAEAELSNATENTLKALSRELGTFQLFYHARKAELTASRIHMQSQLVECETSTRELPHQRTKPIATSQKVAPRVRKSMTKAETDQALDEMVDLARIRRNQARAMFVQRGPRGEDNGLIDSLEAQLRILSEQLTQHTRDMIAFRSKLQMQEDAYNARFGSTRTTSVSMDPRLRRGSAMARIPSPKTLPPLLL